MTARENDYFETDEDAILFQPVARTRPRFYLFIGFLLAIIALAAYAYYIQFQEGFIVTGMRDQVLWGLYITNFVFFIGISHVGILISGILRLSGAEWRRPITRMAEAITVCALVVGVSMVLIDLGRPERMFSVLRYGRIQSPILWDFLSITTYLLGSLIFLYTALVPDIAICRDHLLKVSRWRRWLYRRLALNWNNRKPQKDLIEKDIATMSVLIIPIAVSVHTVVSWIFGMLLRVGWHSTIFGPYFVVGAIYSGVGAVIVAMAVFRRFYHLEDYIKPFHFRYLGYLLFALDLAYIYFTLSEYLTLAYGGKTDDLELLEALFGGGSFALLLYFVIIIGLIVPAFLLVIPRTRTIKGIVFAGILVNICMWIKRFIIIIPTLARPVIGTEWGIYTPTWIEWAITAGGFAVFMLLYAIFSKLFPIVSAWEIKEGREKIDQAVAETE
ncbi:MAG: NrfD/PsrC family molybdoenzyme membrane anchor subunit [Candidatus Heimdallarchaeota archaeon]